jgi:hypothetical protein
MAETLSEIILPKAFPAICLIKQYGMEALNMYTISMLRDKDTQTTLNVGIYYTANLTNCSSSQQKGLAQAAGIVFQVPHPETVTL